MMKPTGVFSSKAEKYARYRWDYAQQAIQTIFDVIGISHHSLVADIGAGTGILTKHFIGKVGQVFVIEPNGAMRQLAEKMLGAHPFCHIMDARAEATTLPDHSVNLITVAEALHWFDPVPTRAEFLRILKPGGWLVKVHNYGVDQELGDAMGKIYPKEKDTSPVMIGKGVPVSFYYGSDDYLQRDFAFTVQESWDEFLGAVSSTSYAPDEDDPFYADFEHAARNIFDRLRNGDVLVLHGITELCVGQIKES